jgi:hypothetical protein
MDRLLRYPHSHPGPGRSAGDALVIRPLGGEAQCIFETPDSRCTLGIDSDTQVDDYSSAQAASSVVRGVPLPSDMRFWPFGMPTSSNEIMPPDARSVCP